MGLGTCRSVCVGADSDARVGGIHAYPIVDEFVGALGLVCHVLPATADDAVAGSTQWYDLFGTFRHAGPAFSFAPTTDGADVILLTRSYATSGWQPFRPTPDFC